MTRPKRNLESLHQELDEAIDKLVFASLERHLQLHDLMPVVTMQRFAELAGLSTSTVRLWVKNGYLPSVRIGKRRLIALDMLREQIKNGDYL